MAKQPCGYCWLNIGFCGWLNITCGGRHAREGCYGLLSNVHRDLHLDSVWQGSRLV